MSQRTPQVVAICCALAFTASAAVQFNDPDPARWIALYGAAALVCVATAFRSLPPALYLGLGVLAAGWAATLLPSVVREAEFRGSEVERELGGLLLIAGAMLFFQRAARRGADPVID